MTIAILWFNYEIQSDELSSKSWRILVSKSSFTSTHKLSRTPHKYWQLFTMTLNSWSGFTKRHCTNISKYNSSFIHRVAGLLVGEDKMLFKSYNVPANYQCTRGFFDTDAVKQKDNYSSPCTKWPQMHQIFFDRPQCSLYWSDHF